MPPAKSISLKQFTTAVQSAVKAAVAKHPKFNVEIPRDITFSYVLRSFPLSPQILSNVSLAETQAFANEVAAGIAAQTGVDRDNVIGNGSVYLGLGHILCGIPPAEFISYKAE